VPRASPVGALTADQVQFLAQFFDPCGQHPPVQFDLLLTRATATSNTAPLPLQVGPASHEPRAQMLKPGQFNLQLTLAALRPRSKYFQDQLGSIEHGNRPAQVQVTLLNRAQRTIEYHGASRLRLDQCRNPVSLARTNKQRLVWFVLAK
jgi:hypothetical protein